MNKKGFTLIELMIVVAIIGILVAVVMPRFQDLSHPQTYTITLYSDTGIVITQYCGAGRVGAQYSNTFYYHGQRIEISDSMKYTCVAEETNQVR